MSSILNILLSFSLQKYFNSYREIHGVFVDPKKSGDRHVM